jgi:hypothetical protein
MTDGRTSMEKLLWKWFGPPLYYCEECLRAVDVQAVENKEPRITKLCDHAAPIIAPRKSILAGEGGLNASDKVKLLWWQSAAKVTGRCV